MGRITPLRLCLIRHGRTRWNKELIFRGGADVPLDAAGRAQARALADRLRPARIAAVYSGPLQRARRTAELIAQPHALPVTLLPGLDDMRFGAWEGRPIAAVRRAQPALFGRWQRQPWRLRIPGGTTLRQIEARSWRALRGIVRRHRGGQTVAVVTHRVVLKLLVLKLLGAGSTGFWRVALDPCSLTVFEWDGSDFTLRLFNDTSHLRRRGGLADF
ncbi:MAG TPA: histidine phosphatase family protein [Candidatus Edwardsbacteria bacterium]|nr:histidine phosphatase family protein [Candidatus Edwardsbacteria bacterium]